jgi:hypothetical protein
MKNSRLMMLALVCLSAAIPVAHGAELHVQALAADQLSANVTGQATGPVLVTVPLSGGLDGTRWNWGISTINAVGSAGSLGQAAASIAVHATLRMQPRSF